MSAEPTPREREYLDCETPMITAGGIFKGLTIGLLIGLLQAAFSPGFDKGDGRIIRTGRLMKYTKYKKAVLRKQAGAPAKGDDKLLKKLNSEPFIFDLDAGPDEFIRRVYEERMNKPSP